MSSQKKLKTYLIIGQGIAGSLLAWHLMKAGQKVLIVDDSHRASSTIVSAGIINPITGQRLALTPQFDLFYAQAKKTYADMSAVLGVNFLVPKPIIRVLRNSDELSRCHQLMSLSASQPFIAGIQKPGYYGPGIHDPYGTLEISSGGHVLTGILLNALKEYFISKNVLRHERFDYGELRVNDVEVQWRSQAFEAVIFCEGFQAKQNPWFNDLSYNFAKGEILKVSFDAPTFPDAILCQQQWCLPAGDGTYLAGSTYDRENIDTKITPEGQENILKGLSQFIPAKAKVLEANAAVRPVMLNGKPIIGHHPTDRRVKIFNGFASKGMLWAPYYAEKFSKEI